MHCSKSDSWRKGDSIDSVQTIDKRPRNKAQKPLWPLSELRINVVRFRCKCTCYDLFNMASGLASQLEFVFSSCILSFYLSLSWLSVDRNSRKQRERVKIYSKVTPTANHWSYELVREKEREMYTELHL